MKNRFPLLALLGLSFAIASCTIGGQPSYSETSSESSSAATTEQTSSGGTSSATSSKDSSASSSSSKESSTNSSESSAQPSSSLSSATSSEPSSVSSSEPSSQTSVSVSLPEPDEHWDLDFSKYGKEFMVTLGKQIVASGKVTSYSDQKTIGPKAAAYPNENSNTFVPFYKEPVAANVISASDFNTTTGWNREHTWPNSRGGGSIEGDAVMIRPAAVKDNSNRGNKFYGLGSGEWDPATCGYEQARGESARIILYCATAYNGSLSLSNNPNDASGKKTMGTLKTLLKWNREYAPTEWERTVNNRLDKYGYRRNPFVDHPEYAEWIWDDNGIRTTPYGGDIPASSSTSSSASSSAAPAVTYNQVTDFSSLDGKEFVITAKLDSSYYNMTDKAKSDSLPWYIIGDPATVNEGKMSSDSEPTFFSFEKVNTDTYVISAADGRMLYGYTAGKYYSIGLAKSEAEVRASQGSTTVSSISNEWKMESIQGGTFQLTTSSVYLEYYNGSFCGYKAAPKDPLMLFSAN